MYFIINDVKKCSFDNYDIYRWETEKEENWCERVTEGMPRRWNIRMTDDGF